MGDGFWQWVCDRTSQAFTSLDSPPVHDDAKDVHENVLYNSFRTAVQPFTVAAHPQQQDTTLL